MDGGDISKHERKDFLFCKWSEWERERDRESQFEQMWTIGRVRFGDGSVTFRRHHNLGKSQSCLPRTLVLYYFLKMGHSWPLFFFIFIFSIQLTVNIHYKFLPMTGFELRTSRIGSDRSTNWATTTAPSCFIIMWQPMRHKLHTKYVSSKLSCLRVL